MSKPASTRAVLRRSATVLAAAVVGGSVALYMADVHGQPDEPNPARALNPHSGAATPTPPPGVLPFNGPLPPAAPLPVPATDLTASFDAVAQASGAVIGLVLTPVGSSEPTLRLGDWSDVGPAWSTIKVPLAVAALRHQTSDTSVLSAAITASDNAAAEQLWSDLGQPTVAAGLVEEVLAASGDSTQVQSRRIRPEFSAFGQTQWPLSEQARFLSSAVCDSRNQPVLTLMRQITAGQRWGLGVLPATAFKGGWGPSPTGQYLVRQIGVVDSPAGQSVVALGAC